MEKTLQKIVFPINDKLKYHYELFYRGSQCGMVTEEGREAMYISDGMNLDFASYLNGLPNNKWKLYSNLKGLRLELEIKGDFILSATGYSMRPVTPERVCFSEKEYHMSETGTVTVEFPETDEEFLAFELTALDKVWLFGGSFIGTYEEEDVRDVNLAIATTTCFKEPFIKGNIKAIREHLIESDDEIAEHLYVNVVDNGRTLSPEDIESDHIRLFPNPNTGGSGGYARGMMESLHMEPHITHVLLMDDDVLILPESIRRTYVLLTVLKKELHEAYISGAMLDYNKMYLQHEDIGTIQHDGFLLRAKPEMKMTKLNKVMKNNRELPYMEHPYAAWWFCCMPREMIEKNGYPMPFFIRGDDVEYGVRSHTQFLSMSGLCVWHMGFANKYNAFMVMYQSLRNLLIVKASSHDIDDCDVIGSMDKCFSERLKELNYDSAELICRALEDFLKGPSFLASADGEKIMKEYRVLNEQMKPLSEFSDIELRLDKVVDKKEGGMYLKERIPFKLTFNGHRFWPESKLKDEVGIISYEGVDQPKRIAFRKTLLAVNKYDGTGALRHFSKERFKELTKRYKALRKEYNSRGEELKIAYSQAKKRFVTEEFWREYLGLDK